MTLSPFEIATVAVYGRALPDAPALRSESDSGLSPLSALERAVEPSLRTPPCLLSFSGGRDSSLLLAVATRIARREGLPLPIPATFRFPAVPATQESAWQERVVHQLGLVDWHRLEFADELDWVGPVAAAVLRKHGVLFPPNAHLHDPLLKAARGGVVVTGWGGDDLFVSPFGRARWVLAGRVRPVLRDLLRVAHLAAPSRLRVWRARRTSTGERLPWLRASAWRAAVARLDENVRSQPRGWDHRLAWLASRRYVALTRQSLDLLGAASDCAVSHPLLEPGFMHALARAGRWVGWPDRTVALPRLFPGLLPPDLEARTSKVLFDEALWASHSRSFASSWDGSGVDPDLVDVDRLRETWLADLPDTRSSLLLQQAWLAADAKRKPALPAQATS